MRASTWRSYLSVAVFLGLVSAANAFALPYLGYRANGLIFLACVLPTAVAFGLGPTLLFSVSSALIWDFFFIPPRFTLSIQTPEDVMMNLTYLWVALVSGFLGSRMRAQESALREREEESTLMYEFEKALAAQASSANILQETSRFIQSHLGSDTRALEAVGMDLRRDSALMGFELSESGWQEALWVFRNEKRAGAGTSTFPSARFAYWPLPGDHGCSGVLLIKAEHVRPELDRLLRLICGGVGVALEREKRLAISRRNALLEESERLHQTLLNSVSHELRTPLTTIIGAVAQLAPGGGQGSSGAHSDLKAAAERLKQTITNLLDLSRINAGVLQLHRTVIDAVDLAQSCLSQAQRLHPGHCFVLVDPSGAVYVRGDERMLETALMNLLSNASAHAPAGSEIRMEVSGGESRVHIRVSDQGAGIPDDLRARVFDSFYTGARGDGIGLGLAIVKAVVDAHRGEVEIEASSPKGATLHVALPRELLPTRLARELEA